MRGAASFACPPAAGLMREAAVQMVAPVAKAFEHLFDGRMINRTRVCITQKVLLADVCHIAAFVIFGEQVVIGLVAHGADVFRDRLIPFFAVCKDRINIDHDTAKAERAVTHDFANGKARRRNGGSRNVVPGLGRKETRTVHTLHIGTCHAANKQERAKGGRFLLGKIETMR